MYGQSNKDEPLDLALNLLTFWYQVEPTMEK